MSATEVNMLKTSTALVKNVDGASTLGLGSVVNVSSALLAAGGDLRNELCSDGVFSLHMTSWKENIHSCGNSSTVSDAGKWRKTLGVLDLTNTRLISVNLAQ
jgi:hypothetical protein